MRNLLQPNVAVGGVCEVDCGALIAAGIHGVMVDLDNTLTRWRDTAVSEAIAGWFDGLREAGLRACVVTNAASASRVWPVTAQLGVPCITRAIKPLPGGFRRGMRALGTAPESTAMIGDQLLTDIYGANRLGVYTILVDPLCPEHEAWSARVINRPLERWLGRGNCGLRNADCGMAG